MKAFVTLLVFGLLLAGCGDPLNDPVSYLKAAESDPQHKVNVVMEEVGFWQGLCASQSPKWPEATAFCKSNIRQMGHLCMNITVLEEARKSGKQDCRLG